MTIIIGVTGVACAGKDTSVDFMIEMCKNSNKTYERLFFARPLKEACKILFNMSDEDVYNQDFKELILRHDNGDPKFLIDGIEASPRIILQWVGSMLRNRIDKNFFLNNMEENINIHKKNNIDFIFITDIRFDNEAELIKNLDGIVIKIERTNHLKIKTSSHESENGIHDKFIHQYIVNDGTIDELRDKVSKFFGKYLD